jgi:predicted phage terminase large subunit-like protein
MSATNPGREGHIWVRDRFITSPTYEDPVDGSTKSRLFIPARLEDNPHIDRDEYVRSLGQLDAISKAQILNGDWTVRRGGMKFQREWFPIVQSFPPKSRLVRYWDLAATAPKKGNQDPDYTVGLLMAEQKGQFWIADIVRRRESSGAIDTLIQSVASSDGRSVVIGMEQEPGASGVKVVDDFARRVLKGYSFVPVRATGSKEVRATPFATAAGLGNVFLVQGDWNADFLDELELFPRGAHDDQVDGASGAHELLTGSMISKDSVRWL